MTTRNTAFTVTSLIAAATGILADAGFNPAQQSAKESWRATVARVYEDPYSVVCVAVYETWAELSSAWAEDQANLVALISTHFARNEAKAWDGYLVLLTPSVVPTNERLTAINIQRNTLHLRKLLAGGEELRSVSAVRRALLPLLPLEEHVALESRGVLDTLPSLLADRGVDEEAVQVAIAAFREPAPDPG